MSDTFGSVGPPPVYEVGGRIGACGAGVPPSAFFTVFTTLMIALVPPSSTAPTFGVAGCCNLLTSPRNCGDGSAGPFIVGNCGADCGCATAGEPCRACGAVCVVS